ncbi:MAG: DUF6351 family protein [Neptuniibacter sp.]
MKLVWMVILFALLSGCSAVKLQQPVKSFPVKPGEVGPVSAQNPLQFPFSCNTEVAGMGEPLIDNQEGHGQPVYAGWLFFDYKKGYSQYCGAPMQVSYWYRSHEGIFLKLNGAKELPTDVEMIDYHGRSIPFVVRYERGVINRFIYGVTVLAEWPLTDSTAPSVVWNNKLLMLFNGGIGIGHHQSGAVSMGMLGAEAPKSNDLISIFNPEMLRRGYVVAGSSGMGTDTSFNLPVLLQTAEMVKQQVITEFGQPEFTIGFGASGGSIQQFYGARQTPDLLDGVIVSHMFPDFLSQATGVGDCELLHYYFDRNHAASDMPDGFWQDWENRGAIEGFNALNDYPTKRSLDDTGVPIMSEAKPGSSVCMEGWRAITPLIFNPKFYLPFYGLHTSWLKNDAEILDQTKWTHWDDAIEVYGRDRNGFALRTYGNVGVQYGLNALKEGLISPATFLDLNAKVGGWKDPAEMTYEYAPFYPYGSLVIGKNVGYGEFVVGNSKLRGFEKFWHGTRNIIPLLPEKIAPAWLKSWLGKQDEQSVWSEHNSTSSYGTMIAPRSVASSEAVRRAEEQGMLFNGQWEKPTISLAVYLDEYLDIHDARQPFIFRQRMLRSQSDRSVFNIWGLKPSGDEPLDKKQLETIAMKAVDVMEQWLVDQQKPDAASDRCWDDDYELIAAGDNVWSEKKTSAYSEAICSDNFPIHGNPRTAAGGPFTSEVLKCDLKNVEVALQDGTYGNVHFSGTQKEYLKKIFPDGVCAY